MARKIKILASGDWIDGGFGTVMRNIWTRLARTGLFDITLVGWHYRGDLGLAKEAMDCGIKLVPTLSFEDGAGPMQQDIIGGITTANVARSIKPDILFVLGDPWQVDGFGKPVPGPDGETPPDVYEGAHRVFYCPIDSDTLSTGSLNALAKCDTLVLYSQFGVDTVRRQRPDLDPRLILHGVDTSIFRLMADGHVANFRKPPEKWSPDKPPYIVLTVGMNQVRKAHPRTLAAFKAATCAVFGAGEHGEDGERNVITVDGEDGKVEFSPPSDWCRNVQKMRCEKCPHYQRRADRDHWLLHFHCSEDGAAGWNLPEMAHRFGIHDRVRVSFKGRHNNSGGVPPKTLAALMNAANVHMMLTHREGFGLPIVETMACGTPNVVTDYSACAELLERGGGVPVPVTDYVINHFHGQVDGIADIAAAAEGLGRLADDEQFYNEQREKGLAFAEQLSWDRIAMEWVELFREIASGV